MDYLRDVATRFAIEHGHATPTDRIETNEAGETFRVQGWRVDLPDDDKALRAQLAKWSEEAADAEHGDRVPAVCAEARRLLKGARCAERCCAGFAGFADDATGACTNVNCANCWPDRCASCGTPASLHTDDEDPVRRLSDDAAAALGWIGARLRAIEADAHAGVTHKGEARELIARGQKIAAEPQSWERVACERRPPDVRCSADGGHRWNPIGGLVERIDAQ
jgi:hypothetical protein